jgi:hypothetical protein
MTPEAAAESICAIIRSGEHRKTMVREALRMLFERKHGSIDDLDFAEGLNLAVSDGRLRANDVHSQTRKEAAALPDRSMMRSY